ncbi:MAG: hypothetical protein ABIG56_02385 [Candidatus Omnitrophota bacterium]
MKRPIKILFFLSILIFLCIIIVINLMLKSTEMQSGSLSPASVQKEQSIIKEDLQGEESKFEPLDLEELEPEFEEPLPEGEPLIN